MSDRENTPRSADGDDSLDLEPLLEARADRATLNTNDVWKALETLASQAAGSKADRIGDYPIVRRLGQGGFGTVYEGRDPITGARVALKEPRFALPEGSSDRQRFINEATAAQGLNHPNLVSVQKIFATERSLCIVSQYVEGPNLSRWLADRTGTVPPRAAATLTRLLAAGVEHLHRQRRPILHRDLKPSNVLLDTEDPSSPAIEGLSDRLVPRITDFGLARIEDAGGQDSLSGVGLGTPPYMAPEQFIGKRGDINKTTDVYGLGAILYECLTGVPPFQADDPAALMLRVVNEPPVSPRLLRPDLPRDLVTICLKCLEKEAARRYPSAQALADDLDRYLEGEPIIARPVSRLERAWRWARRRPREAVPAAAAALLVGMIVVGSLVVAGILSRKNAELQETLHSLQRMSLADHVVSAYQHEQAERLDLALASLRDARQILGREVQPGFAWGLMNGRVNRRLNLIWSEMAKIDDVVAVLGATGPAESRLVAIGDSPSMVQLWDVAEPKLIDERPIPVSTSGHVTYTTGPICLFDHFRRQQPKERFQIIDGGTLEDLGSIEIDGGLDQWPCAELLEGDRLAIGFKGRQAVEIHSYREPGRMPREIALDGRLAAMKASLKRDELFALTYDDAGMNLVQVLPDGDQDGVRSLHRINARSRERMWVHAWGCDLGISPDGRWLGMNDPVNQRVRLWDRRTGQQSLSMPLDEEKIGRLVFSPDGRHVAFGHGTGKVMVVATETGEVVARFAMPVYAVTGMAFDADGSTLNLSSSDDGRIWRWHFQEGPARSLRHNAATEWNCAVYLPDAETIVAGGETGQLHLVRGDRPPRQILVEPDGSGITDVILLDGGERAVTSSWSTEGNLRVVDLKTGQVISTMAGHAESVRDLALSPDGRTLASAGSDTTIRLWDVQTLKCLRVLKAHSDKARTVAFSPDGRELWTAANEGLFLRWSVATGELLDQQIRSLPVQAMAYSADGRWMAFGEETGLIVIENRKTGERREVHGHGSTRGVQGLAFHPNSLELASSGGDGAVAIWDVTTARQVLRFAVHQGEVRDVAFSPDGQRLVSVGEDGAVHEWSVDR